MLEVRKYVCPPWEHFRKVSFVRLRHFNSIVDRFQKGTQCVQLECVMNQRILASNERVDKAILSAPASDNGEHKSNWTLTKLALILTQETELARRIFERFDNSVRFFQCCFEDSDIEDVFNEKLQTV